MDEKTRKRTLTEKIKECFNSIGHSVYWPEAKEWFEQRYGPDHGVTKSMYCCVKSHEKAKRNKAQLTPGVPKTPITYEEMVAVSRACEKLGGVERVLQVLVCLKNVPTLE